MSRSIGCLDKREQPTRPRPGVMKTRRDTLTHGLPVLAEYVALSDTGPGSNGMGTQELLRHPAPLR